MLSSSFTTALVICGAEVLEGGVNGGWIPTSNSYKASFIFAVRIPGPL